MRNAEKKVRAVWAYFLAAIAACGLLPWIVLVCHFQGLDAWAQRIYYCRPSLDDSFDYSVIAFFIAVSFLVCLGWRRRRTIFLISVANFILQSGIGIYMKTGLCALVLPLTAFLLWGCWRKTNWAFGLIAVGASLLAFRAFRGPVFMENVICSPVSKAQSDMRGLGTAIEAYCVDAGAYPAWTMNPSEWVAFRSTSNLPSFRRYKRGGAMSLTSPTAYITDYPRDPFRATGNTYAYWAPPEGGWILLSAGPDCVFDLDFGMLRGVYLPTTYNPTVRLMTEFTYDPTNGSESAGDIWRVKS